MTVETFPQFAQIEIQTLGPHPIPFPYEEGTVLCYVIVDGQHVALDPADFSPTPASSTTQGSLYLSLSAYEEHEGHQLVIARRTPEEQTWLGLMGGREKGLERQLDRATMRLQEVSRDLAGALRVFGALAPIVPVPNAVVAFDENGQPVSGPTMDQIAAANAAGQATQAALERCEEIADILEAITDSTVLGFNFGPFVGDGETRTFALPGTVTGTSQVYLYLDGVAQIASAYSVAGNLLTFASAPKPGEIGFGKVLVNLSVASAAADAILLQSGQTVQGYTDRISGFTTPELHGAVPDEEANNEPALEAAFATGRARLLDRTYATAYRLSADDGLKIVGEGHATIRQLARGTVGPLYTLDLQNDLTVQGVRFDLDVDAAATNGAYVFAFDVPASRIVLDGISVTGNIEIDPDTGARNGLAGLALMNNGGVIDGLTIRDSQFEGLFYTFLQSNTITGQMKNVSITGSSFDEYGSIALLFNAPASGALNENILIAGNSFGANRSRSPFGSGVGYPHRGSFAGHVEYTRLIGNHAHGYGGEFWRAEEAAKASVWLGNTGKLTGRDGAEIIANHAGGTVRTPTMFAIQANVLENIGLEADSVLGAGLKLFTYTSVAGLENAECIGESVITGNIVKGWGEGIVFHQGAQRNLLAHNVMVGTSAGAKGIQSWAPSTGMIDNMVTDCDVTVDAQRGGMMGRVHLRSAVAAIPEPGAVTVTDGPLTLQGWTWETGRFNAATGYTYFDLFDLGDSLSGRLTISVNKSGSTYTVESGVVTYDGSELVYYRDHRMQGGGVNLSLNGLGIQGGKLAIAIFNGTGVVMTNVSIQCAFDGAHIWTA